jgi:predicted DNA-binding transcriptional regulator AlpA
MTEQKADPLDLIRDPQVAKLLGVSLRTLARWDADPDNNFPRPIIVNARKSRPRGELEAWLPTPRARDFFPSRADTTPE